MPKFHEAKHQVSVTLDMVEHDIAFAESKAIYEEIKEYALKKYGLQITNLNIVHVKKKCSIIERKNCNKA